MDVNVILIGFNGIEWCVYIYIYNLFATKKNGPQTIAKLVKIAPRSAGCVIDICICKPT